MASRLPEFVFQAELMLTQLQTQQNASLEKETPKILDKKPTEDMEETMPCSGSSQQISTLRRWYAMAFMESRREVPLNDDVTEAAASKFFGIRQWLYTWRKQLLALALIGITFLICWESANEFSSFQTPHVAKTRGLPGHLAGVNLGGWLCLEDWFYSGNSGLHVSTIDHDGQGRCLPPLRSIPWTSEGNLTFELNRSKGVLDLFKDVNGATNQRYLDDHVKDVASHHPSLFDGRLVEILFSIFSTVWGNDPDSSWLIWFKRVENTNFVSQPFFAEALLFTQFCGRHHRFLFYKSYNRVWDPSMY